MFVLLALFSSLLLPVEAFMLITFDVDGTLVRQSDKPGSFDTSAHARAFSHAASQIYGKPVPPVAEVLPKHKFL